jgi:hypothetical protein
LIRYINYKSDLKSDVINAVKSDMMKIIKGDVVIPDGVVCIYKKPKPNSLPLKIEGGLGGVFLYLII